MLLTCLLLQSLWAATPDLPPFVLEAGCRVQSSDQGKADTMSFTEIRLDCGDVMVKMEMSRPVSAATVDRQVLNETIMVQENYSAMRNPYAGFVSDTAQCPVKKNFIRGEFRFDGKPRPLLTGRLTGRGTWGACGTAEEDLWGAITFVSKHDAMMKVQITAKKKLARKDFNLRAETLLRAVKARM